MQIISSLLRLQFSQLKDEKTSGVFQVCQNRIRSMALIHEKLYQSDDFSKIDFSGYLKSLIRSLCSIYQEETGDVEVKLDLETIHLSINQAIPLGLISNELISNALKHAFPGRGSRRPDEYPGEKAQLQVVLERKDSRGIHLRVCDNGVGLPPGFDLQNADGLGWQLVQDLVNQLNGTLEIESRRGTCFKIGITR